MSHESDGNQPAGLAETVRDGRRAAALESGQEITLLPQYRELAERLGVRLIHHDGGQEEAMSRLPDLLAASDAVPTDCISHTAGSAGRCGFTPTPAPRHANAPRMID
ncbi:MAG: DUF2325 domain-containing protein [Pseudomonadota bacterium]